MEKEGTVFIDRYYLETRFVRNRFWPLLMHTFVNLIKKKLGCIRLGKHQSVLKGMRNIVAFNVCGFFFKSQTGRDT